MDIATCWEMYTARDTIYESGWAIYYDATHKMIMHTTVGDWWLKGEGACDI